MKDAGPKDLNRIRGWLLVWVIVLIPHGVSSVLGLFILDSVARGGPLGTATLLVTGVGNLTGIALILSRKEMAPAFFTLYPPFLLVLTLAHPDLLGVANARLAAIGATGEVPQAQLTALLAVNIPLVGLLIGYWVRSARVQAVFSTRGLEILRRRRLEGKVVQA